MEIARNVEVWIFGAFAGLVVAACLSGPAERSAPPASAVVETELAQPQEATQMMATPMYVVYVTAKRLGAAEKRALRRPG